MGLCSSETKDKIGAEIIIITIIIMQGGNRKALCKVWKISWKLILTPKNTAKLEMVRPEMSSGMKFVG